MEKKLNDLVERLTKEQSVVFSRPEKSVAALIESISRNYVHILFVETGTEIGIQLIKDECVLADLQAERPYGIVKLTGLLTLNYDKVKCRAEINLSNCQGLGYLHPVSDEEYSRRIRKDFF